MKLSSYGIFLACAVALLAGCGEEDSKGKVPVRPLPAASGMFYPGTRVPIRPPIVLPPRRETIPQPKAPKLPVTPRSWRTPPGLVPPPVAPRPF